MTITATKPEVPARRRGFDPAMRPDPERLAPPLAHPDRAGGLVRDRLP